MLAEALKAAGYATGCIGKWHLGFLPGMRPMDQGFDSYYGVLHNLDKFETVMFGKEGGMPFLRGDAVVARPAEPAQMTALYTAEALQFIERHRDQPFFLYLAHAMPHLPLDASPKFKANRRAACMQMWWKSWMTARGRLSTNSAVSGWRKSRSSFSPSDNGPERSTPGTAAPLRGTKHTVFEGGLRVPFLAWWPGKVPAGRVSSDFMTALDLLPTLARLAGTSLPNDRPSDGLDASAQFLGETGAHHLRERLY
ncbi:MAG: sulfatase-like hydrolase/transferase [Chthoniobacteraceae bacterium]